MHRVAHRLDALLAPDYLEGLTALPIEDIRARRTECQQVEDSLSYPRRVVQGRLDIVLAELKQRREGGSGDAQSLVERLPSILSDQSSTRPSSSAGRLQTSFGPTDLPEDAGDLLARIDSVADDRRLSNITAASDEELDGLVEELRALEVEISSQRRQLHERIDALEKELVRRYKSGEADVNSLLT